MDSFPPDAPAPRLCHVVKRADFEGFGFNLYAGKVKQGQFIGKVDANSPAEAAGLKPGDRIIEVNSVNIGNENHKQVNTEKVLSWEIDRREKNKNVNVPVGNIFFTSAAVSARW